MAKQISVIIVAAGSSNRMGMNTNKIFLDLCGRSVIERTISAFTDIPEIFEIILVTKKEFFDDFKNIRLREAPQEKNLLIMDFWKYQMIQIL